MSITPTTFHGDVNNSQLQQASDNSAQAQTNIDYEKIQWIADKVKENINDLNLDDLDIVKLNGELDTVHENLRNPKPSIEIVGPALLSIKTILEAAAGNILATQYAEEISTVLPQLLPS